MRRSRIVSLRLILPVGTRLTSVELAQEIGYLPHYERDGTPIKAFRSDRDRNLFCAEIRQNGWEPMFIRSGKRNIKGWGN